MLWKERKKMPHHRFQLNSSQNHVISVMWHGHMISWKSCGQYFKSFQKGKFMRPAALLIEKNAKY
jgi:hypothetical protein